MRVHVVMWLCSMRACTITPGAMVLPWDCHETVMGDRNWHSTPMAGLQGQYRETDIDVSAMGLRWVYRGAVMRVPYGTSWTSHGSFMALHGPFVALSWRRKEPPHAMSRRLIAVTVAPRQRCLGKISRWSVSMV